jgi:transporter family protein
MDKWVVYAIASAVFAGFTAVIAKLGLVGISGELGLTVRTCFVFVMVLVFAGMAVPRAEVGTLTTNNLMWLGISGLTTSASWIFYYKALKLGEVSTIALIDKGSFLVAVLLAWLLLREQITPRVLLGAALILSGLIVVARR